MEQYKKFNKADMVKNMNHIFTKKQNVGKDKQY